MVDIHSHILYGIDDGAKTLEQSLAMVRMAADCGTTDIVATPHSDLKYRFQPEVISARILELQTEMGDRIRIHRGCDFHLHIDNLQSSYQDPSRYTINGLKYLMVEFADQSIPKTATQLMQELLAYGMIPVITHPERNKLLLGMLDAVAEWIRMGCLVQVTGQSFSGRFGNTAERGARELMDKNMVHFVASDAHDTEHRPPDLREPYAFVEKHWGKAMAEKLFVTNPKATLTGAEIEYEEPQISKKKSGWKLW